MQVIKYFQNKKGKFLFSINTHTQFIIIIIVIIDDLEFEIFYS
jgi:hypothetical protein